MANQEFKLDLDMSEFDALVKRLQDKLSQREASATFIAMDSGGKEMMKYAKKNRPWTDRTGDAKRALIGGAYVADKEISAFVGHGVYYGLYLEMSNQRKYAILERARNQYAKSTLENVRKVLLER